MNKKNINRLKVMMYSYSQGQKIEGATHTDLHKRTCKTAFTLAEVLITLGIIGVVAAITLPQFMQDMSERINSNRQANIAQKITKSVELMIVNGDYQGIYDTNQFVNKLSKYLKIAKKCDKNNLDKCWPSKKIKTAKGEEYDVADAKTSKALHTKGPETDNVGLVLADGASIILTFNPDEAAPSAEGGFRAIRKNLPVGNGKTKEFAYTSNATNAIDFVMDVNGGTGPNQEADNSNYYDIRSFKGANFTHRECPGEKGPAGCIYIPTTIVPAICVPNNPEYAGDEYCGPTPSGYGADYWAGAKRACDEEQMRLPTQTELKNIYTHRNEYPSIKDVSSGFWWSSAEYGNHHAYSVRFPDGLADYQGKIQPYKVLCVDK